MIRNFLIILFAVIILTAPAVAQKKTQKDDQKHTFVFSNSDFLLDGQPFQIIAGEFIRKNSCRILASQDPDGKSHGCNTIRYNLLELPWSRRGSYDFETGNRNLAEFFKIVKEEGMWLIVRLVRMFARMGTWRYSSVPAAYSWYQIKMHGPALYGFCRKVYRKTCWGH